MNDLEKTLAQMASEALTVKDDEQVQLTEQDVKLDKEVFKPSSAERTWLGVVAGLLDGQRARNSRERCRHSNTADSDELQRAPETTA
jgi:hypothetical protein